MILFMYYFFTVSPHSVTVEAVEYISYGIK